MSTQPATAVASSAPSPGQEKQTSRLEAFSDGIFGVAITLLAIEIAVSKDTPATNAGLWHGLLLLWPKYVAYCASFIQIMFMWIAHHAIFGMVRRTNVKLMLANGFVLLLVVLVPLPTKTLGEFIDTDAQLTAAALYTGYFVLISIAFNLLTQVAASPRYGLLEPGAAANIGSLVKSQRIGLVCNVLITASTFANIWLALALSVGMWVYWARMSMAKEEVMD